MRLKTKPKYHIAKLSKGWHPPDGEACVMEYVSVLAGEKWSDSPICTDGSLAAYLRVLNDRSPQWVRDRLQRLAPRIAKTRTLPNSWRWVWAESARQSAICALGPVRGAHLSACAVIIDAVTAKEANAAAAAHAAHAAAAAAAANAAAAAANAAAANAAAANAAAANAAAHAAAYAAYAAANARPIWETALALVERALSEAKP